MANIKVMLSAAFKEAYLELVPPFERASGHKVENLWVPSVQMMNRLKDGETVDLVILSAAALEKLVARKQLIPDDELARRIDEWDAAARATPHGKPVELKR